MRAPHANANRFANSQKNAGSWVRTVEMMAAQKLRSTGATLSISDLKSKAAEQAQYNKKRLLVQRNKTRAAQAERKATRLVAAASKELEELTHGPSAKKSHPPRAPVHKAAAGAGGAGAGAAATST